MTGPWCLNKVIGVSVHCSIALFSSALTSYSGSFQVKVKNTDSPAISWLIPECISFFSSSRKVFFADCHWPRVSRCSSSESVIMRQPGLSHMPTCRVRDVVRSPGATQGLGMRDLVPKSKKKMNLVKQRMESKCWIIKLPLLLGVLLVLSQVYPLIDSLWQSQDFGILHQRYLSSRKFTVVFQFKARVLKSK